MTAKVSGRWETGARLRSALPGKLASLSLPKNLSHKLKRDFIAAERGFDFSFDEFVYFWQQNDAQYPVTQTHLCFDTVVAA